jgi:hypothetical protein
LQSRAGNKEFPRKIKMGRFGISKKRSEFQIFSRIVRVFHAVKWVW